MYEKFDESVLVVKILFIKLFCSTAHWHFNSSIPKFSQIALSLKSNVITLITDTQKHQVATSSQSYQLACSSASFPCKCKLAKIFSVQYYKNNFLAPQTAASGVGQELTSNLQLTYEDPGGGLTLIGAL